MKIVMTVEEGASGLKRWDEFAENLNKLVEEMTHLLEVSISKSVLLKLDLQSNIPLIEAGLPTANIVDFSYGPGNSYWHTLDDDLRHVSGATLEIVGEVVAELIYSGG